MSSLISSPKNRHQEKHKIDFFFSLFFFISRFPFNGINSNLTVRKDINNESSKTMIHPVEGADVTFLNVMIVSCHN